MFFYVSLCCVLLCCVLLCCVLLCCALLCCVLLYRAVLTVRRLGIGVRAWAGLQVDDLEKGNAQLRAQLLHLNVLLEASAGSCCRVLVWCV